MKESIFCRCCMSVECYKDMANEYYFSGKSENYFEMLRNIFNINISNKDGHRCLICEECVAKLRDAAAFKTQVLNVQETIKKKVQCGENSSDEDTSTDLKIEDDDFDDFDDQISDSFVWDSHTEDCAKNGQALVIKLEPKLDNVGTVPETTNPISNGEDGNTASTDCNRQSARAKRTLIKSVTEKQIKEKAITKKRNVADSSKPELHSNHTRENTLKLIHNSNLCIFRSLQNKFGCNLCTAKFFDITQLREHSLTHTNSKVLTLKVQRLRGLSYKNADISDLKCKKCGENLTDLTALTAHLTDKHNVSFHGNNHFLIPYNLLNGFKCVLCEAQFNSYLRLAIHMNSHYANNVCEMCGQSFINRLSLRAHVHSMHKEKKCSLCPATFLTNSAKVKHLRITHNFQNLKRYCNICSKTFRYTYMVDEHKIQEHGYKRQTCNCTECGKTFFSTTNLKLHIRSVHIKERNYPCSVCGMRFFTKCDQKRHERTHEDVRSFSCSYCERKFKSKDSWRRHLKRKHGHVFGQVS